MMRRGLLAGAAAPLLLLATPAAAAPASGLCAGVSVPGLPVCRAAPGGIVIGSDAAEVEDVARLAAEGEQRFRLHFGEPVRYAVAVDPTDAAAAREALGAAGFSTVLPWLGQAEQRRRLEASVRRSVAAQLEGKGLDEATKEQAVQQALVQLEQRRSGPGQSKGNAAVPHELGHLWLVQAYWAGRAPTPEGEVRYGGPGPDWLDETAAVMMEGEVLTAPRRAQFRNLYQGKAPGAVLPLAEFLTMEHPMLRTAAAMAAASGGGGQGVMMITGDELRSRGIAPEASANFYSQSRVFADFLLARSGDPRIVGHIAEALAAGSTIDRWLAAHGPRHRLGGSVAELEREWQSWLEAEYRDPPA